MRRTLVAVGLVIAGLVVGQIGLAACGDKSLSAGGIMMQRALATKFHASILIYSPPGSRLAAAAHELKLQQTLRQVGHTYREATTSAELEAALASGEFNVVMADITEVSAVRQRVPMSRSSAAVVAVGYKLTKAEAKNAEKTERFLVNAPSRMTKYLGTLIDAVRSAGPVRRQA